MGKSQPLQNSNHFPVPTEDIGCHFSIILNSYLAKKYNKCISCNNLEVFTLEQFLPESGSMARSWTGCLDGQVITLYPVGNQFCLHLG